MASIKGIQDVQDYDGSSLRIAILHARWNITIVDKLVAGAKKSLLGLGVEEKNIVIQSVSGCWELPLAVHRIISAPSRTDVSNPSPSSTIPPPITPVQRPGAFDAVIAVGVLIKGQTMHFEHIAESVSRGLMRVQLDSGVPVVFGVLTVLDEDQAFERAGMSGSGESRAKQLGKAVETTGTGKNHGEQWGRVAVEMGVKSKQWAEGVFA
ncbi:MAG: hypothetical protein M1840_000981 [Geoglossum simile]|nr:MAG: hypothetical protein M1840_000981 [Geoglossum simile]